MTTSTEVKHFAVAAYQRGASLREVARTHGVAHQTVRLWVLAAGVPLRQTGPAPSSRRRLLEALLTACRAAAADSLPPEIRDAMGALS